MKETYSRPIVTNAGTMDNANELFPVVEALSAGYAAGKSVRKVFSGEISEANTAGLVKRKEYKD